ncbi:MAG: YkgJ family cysteine cluster protein [Candidatus Woesearchaeota archaeon]|jgi:Fe-S-cluster containining protein
METFERENFKHVNITKHTPENIIAEFGKECTRCNHCCKVDSGILFVDDITRIADYLHMPRDEFVKEYLEEHERFHTKCWKLKQIKADKPYGQCILLKEHGCSVHEAKPTYCRLLSTASKHGEQLAVWFALNNFVNPHDPESIRQWAVYLKTHPTIPGGNLQDLIPDKEKLRRILSYEHLQ